MSWFRHTPTADRFLAQERLIVSVAEKICDMLNDKQVSRGALAKRLGVSKGEVSQRLSGERNMSLKSLSDVAFALDAEVRIEIVDRDSSLGAPARVAGSGVTRKQVVPNSYRQVGDIYHLAPNSVNPHALPYRQASA